LGTRLLRRPTYALGFFAAGAPRLVALALMSSVSPVLAISFLGGLGAGGINPILGAVEYERVPRHLQARVLGAVGASAWAGIPFGSLAGGIAVSSFGLRPALLTAGALYGVTTLAPFVFPVWRQMERGRPAPFDAEGSGSGADAESAASGDARATERTAR
ncbi:MAG: MFS transporter, partial [Acidimicrobiales bacterium]